MTIRLIYNLVLVSSIEQNHLSWGGWHNIVGLLWHLKHIDCLKYIPQCAPLLLPAFKQLSFSVTVNYFSNFHFEIVVGQSKTSFVTFMVPTGCPNANVYILNSSCDLHFEFWVNWLSLVSGVCCGPCNLSKWEAVFCGWFEVWRPVLLCFTVNHFLHWACWQYDQRIIWAVGYIQIWWWKLSGKDITNNY